MKLALIILFFSTLVACLCETGHRQLEFRPSASGASHQGIAARIGGVAAAGAPGRPGVRSRGM